MTENLPFIVQLDPSLLKNNAKSSVIIAVASMATPFGLGAAISKFYYSIIWSFDWLIPVCIVVSFVFERV